MPGMMDTVLNLGLNDETVEGLAKRSPAMRALPMTAIAASSRCIPTSCSASDTTVRGNPRRRQGRKGYPNSTPNDADDWKAVVAATRRAVEQELGKPFPQDPHEQLWGAIGAVFGSG
jgi:pyruvate,orthophosphate dikinase